MALKIKKLMYLMKNPKVRKRVKNIDIKRRHSFPPRSLLWKMVRGHFPDCSEDLVEYITSTLLQYSANHDGCPAERVRAFRQLTLPGVYFADALLMRRDAFDFIDCPFNGKYWAKTRENPYIYSVLCDTKSKVGIWVSRSENKENVYEGSEWLGAQDFSILKLDEIAKNVSFQDLQNMLHPREDISIFVQNHAERVLTSHIWNDVLLTHYHREKFNKKQELLESSNMAAQHKLELSV